jgi:hypothetical protein
MVMELRKQLFCIIAAALVASTGFIAVVAKADTNKKIRVKKSSGSSISALYTGVLQGKIKVGGQDVLITKKTTIYQTGDTRRHTPRSVVKKAVYVSGKMRNGVLVAQIVLVSDKNKSGVTPLTMEMLKPKPGDIPE